MSVLPPQSFGALPPQSFGALPLRLGAMIRPTASGRLRSVKTPGRVATCRDARSDADRRSVRCVKGYSVRCRTARRVTAVGTHDLCVRCIKSYSVVVFNGNGRTDRASLQPLHVTTATRNSRYTSCCTTTDALPLDTLRASLQPLYVTAVTRNNRYT